jgi:ketosteroid isomerase-like protein
VVGASGLEEKSMLTELHGLSERWYQAWLEKDATTVELLMAEDYHYVGPNGLALDRQAILAIIGSPSYRLEQGTRTEIIIRAVGHEAAIVRHRWKGAGSFEGTSFTDDNRCVLVWEKQAEGWRIVLDQCSFSSK